jgi:2-amino-4-hydroxy-6-hydroxymethyldihydropteridine diphosphokinase
LTTVYLSLGSNVGDRERIVRAALEHLSPTRVSPLYETEPVDYTDQAWFLNMVAEARTELGPAEFLARTQQIERDLGRERTVPKGPRTLDIDILFFGDAVIHTATLEIPHPRLTARRFVLQPLADLAPRLRHPVTGASVQEMLASLTDTVVVRPWKRSTQP